jgi:predicted NAD/FAD-dependent oxidoreductase
MLEAFQKLVGSSYLEPTFVKSQLWGAALPLNSPRSPCIFDGKGRVGICGDWLLGSSIECAALSGRHMAEHLKAVSDGSCGGDLDVALNTPLIAIDAPALGNVL